MSGASRAHNLIAVNLLGACTRSSAAVPEAYGSDMKVRLSQHGETWFYYPDVMVSCDRDLPP